MPEYEDYDYSKRGRYGDTTQRCAWCGKPTDVVDRSCWGGTFRGNYCSFTCSSAGMLDCNLGLFLCFSALAIVFAALAPVLIIAFIPALMCLGMHIVVGMEERGFKRKPIRSQNQFFAGGVSRHVVDSISGAEAVISGYRDMTVRDAMTFEWPFKDRKRKAPWVVWNEQGEDVTDTLLSETEGILKITFSQNNESA